MSPAASWLLLPARSDHDASRACRVAILTCCDLAQDLKKAELNSLVGIVRQYDEGKGRVGVEFPPPHGLLSLRTKNLFPLATLADELDPAAATSLGPHTAERSG